MKSCDEVETVREFTYLGYRVSTDGWCVAALNSVSRMWGINLSECYELLCEFRFPLRLKGVVYKSYVRQILQKVERSVLRAMSGEQL